MQQVDLEVKMRYIVVVGWWSLEAGMKGTLMPDKFYAYAFLTEKEALTNFKDLSLKHDLAFTVEVNDNKAVTDPPYVVTNWCGKLPAAGINSWLWRELSTMILSTHPE